MVQWGIVGCGNIANKFASDLKLVPNANIQAVASRNLDKAKIFADNVNAAHAYGSYEELFKDKNVTVVYIATPHNNHADLSIQAMKNGKHVLCEKPLGINETQVKAMVNMSKKNNVFLMEGLWSRFNPTIKKVKHLIQEGEIGDLHYLKADFAFYGLHKDKNGRLLNIDLAGGSLLDIGLYPVFLAYLFLGKPKKIMATSNFYSTGIEVQTSIIFHYKNAQAILYSGLNSTTETSAEFSGSKGSIKIPTRWHEAQSYILNSSEKTTSVSMPTKGNGFTYEIEEVQNCILENKIESKLWSHQNSIDLAYLLDTIRKEAGVIFPFEE